MRFDVSILGEIWHVRIEPTETDVRLSECDGFCDKSERLIVIDDMSTTKNFELGNKSEYIKQSIRHEVVHAFLMESGLQGNWEHKEIGHEETTVEWIAVQFWKMVNVIRLCEERYMNNEGNNAEQP